MEKTIAKGLSVFTPFLVNRYDMTKERDYPIGRHRSIEERHKNMTEGRDYSIGRHRSIGECHKNMTEGRNYSIGRHRSIEERHC